MASDEPALDRVRQAATDIAAAYDRRDQTIRDARAHGAQVGDIARAAGIGRRQAQRIIRQGTRTPASP